MRRPRDPRFSEATEFEVAVQRSLRELGWTARLTPRTGDFGADVIAECGKERLVVQCKRYAAESMIPFKAVQEIVFAQKHFEGSLAALVYSGRLSSQAFSALNKHSVYALRLADLVIGCELDRSIQGRIFRQNAECLQILSLRAEWNLRRETDKRASRRSVGAVALGGAIAAIIWAQGHIGYALLVFLGGLTLANSFGGGWRLPPHRADPSDADVARARDWLTEFGL